jgi:hypothetical protein
MSFRTSIPTSSFSDKSSMGNKGGNVQPPFYAPRLLRQDSQLPFPEGCPSGFQHSRYRPNPDSAKHRKSNGSSLQPSSSGHPNNLSGTQFPVRGLIGALLVAVVLTTFNALLPSHTGPKPFSLENVAIQVASSILYVAIMAPLARQVSDPLSRFLVIFIPMYKRLNGAAIQ